MTDYLVASDRESLTYAGRLYTGSRCTPCEGRGHMLYKLPLSAEDVSAFRRTPWSRPEGGGRKTLPLPSGEEVFVSANPACRWPGSSLRPTTDQPGPSPDAGPVAAGGHGSRPHEPPRVLSHEDQRWLVRRMIELLRANEPRYERVTKRLLVDLLRRWTSDGSTADGMDLEALWTSFEVLPHTHRAIEARETRAFKHEHAVPCRVLRDWLLEDGTRSEDEIHAVLARCCVAALVHDDEDALLPRTTMPEGWTVSPAADSWARYKAVRMADGRSLHDLLVFPRR